MKNSTLRFSNRTFLIFGISSMSVFCHFTSYSQAPSLTSKSQDLKNIQVPVFANEAERQEWILSHPDEYHFLIGSNKKEAIESKEVLPSDFPKYINTGNPELDIQNYSKQKEKWVIEHPEAYKKMQEPASTPTEIKNN